MSHLRPSVLAPLAAVIAALAAPAAAAAAQRYTTQDATATTGACPASAPCRVDVAVNQAAAGDEVVVAPGTYAVTAALDPRTAIDLHGVAGQPRPRLTGIAGVSTALLSMTAGGTLRHLRIEASGPAQDAVTLQGVVAEDLILLSDSGDGGKVVGATNGTVLRDSLIRTASSGDGAAGLKVRTSGQSGDVALRNLTVLAPSGIGVRCELMGGQATIVNSIVRGRDGDAPVTRMGAQCSAAHSNLRAAKSSGLTLGEGMQETDPLYADPTAGDYRPVAGSPTIDAGAGDALLGSADPAGCPRTLGLAPDIGAFEYADAATPCALAPAELIGPATVATGGDQGDDTSDDTPPAVVHDVIRGIPSPVVGKTVVVAPGQGKVLVRRPGSTRFRALTDSASVPVGSVLDARAGRVKLVSVVDAAGHLQLGTFWGGKFEVRQTKRDRGTVNLLLRGGGLGACPATAPHAGASIATARKRPRRSLWAKDRHGRYRTHGQSSAATARGTRWVTTDTCSGTRTRVLEGSVAVRDRVKHRTVIVRAGHSYLAHATR